MTYLLETNETGLGFEIGTAQGVNSVLLKRARKKAQNWAPNGFFEKVIYLNSSKFQIFYFKKVLKKHPKMHPKKGSRWKMTLNWRPGI